MIVVAEHAKAIATGAFLAAGVVAVVVALVVTAQRESTTRRELQETRAAIAGMCAYQASGTVQGNARVRFIAYLAAAIGTFLDTAATTREASALHEARTAPDQARTDLAAATRYRAQKAALEARVRAIHPRPGLVCPGSPRGATP